VSKILVIDGQAQSVKVSSEFLSKSGYRVRGLCDPHQGIAAFQTFRPDLCILGFRMPGITGADLLNEFRTLDSNIEVIFLTAEGETDLVIDMMKAVAIDYLLRPVCPGPLAAAVRRALEHRRLVRENTECRKRLEHLVSTKTATLNEALHSLETMHAATLQSLGKAIDFRDRSTSGHSHRVASWTTGIARKIGISGSELKNVEHGSLLHDIGKLKIPDEILLKPGELNDVEWRIMRRHAEFGKEFLDSIDFLRPAVDIVYAHHEKFDGSGYPRSLRGEAIPVGARCFAIVDAVDAMIFKRPYNRPVSFERASAEIRRCAGGHFDPELVEVALNFLSTHVGDKASIKQLHQTA
jgi:putative nucleotidyltransferase with HDIG domain